jgi:hypothetical protein
MLKLEFNSNLGCVDQENGEQHNRSVILLTACVNAREVSFLVRRNTQMRMEDYKGSIQLWLADRKIPYIVFCDNSGYDLSEIEKICKEHNIHNKEIELLTFDGQEFSPDLGKGYGEMRIISHALAHSKLISQHPMIMKVTGRFYVKNAAAIIEKIVKKKADIFCDLRWNLTHADSRVFCASIPFLQQYLIPLQESLNDSRNITFEHILARAVHQAMAHGRRWEMLPHPADIRGISATANVVIPSSLLYRAKRRLFRLIKASVLAR